MALGESEVKQFVIDLSSIYDLSPNTPACEILYSILRNYDIKGIICLNLSPDVGSEIYEFNIDMREELEKRLEESEDPINEITILAKEHGHTVIWLEDGYETAVAIVLR